MLILISTEWEYK